MELWNPQNLAIFFTLFITVTKSTCQDDLIVKTRKGEIRGTHQYSRGNKKFASFEGIRYAKPPKRFEPPEEPDSWTGIIDATAPGYPCPQFDPVTSTFHDESEDCLTLSVFVPSNLDDPLTNFTTMFWIHGGSYMFGSGLTMGPNYIMDEDVILVTINYRLGAFGFLSSGDEVVRGNMGFKDMIMALRWVNENIEAFGGDPEKVTIFGESAGAAAVHSLMLSPVAKGLFSKVIAQSGCALAPWNTMYEPAKTFKIIANDLNCTGLTTKENLICLRNKPVIEILKAQLQFLSTSFMTFSTTVDKVSDSIKGDYSVFPEQFETLIETGNNNKRLPLIMGRNDAESLGKAKASLEDSATLELMNTNWTQAILSMADYTMILKGNNDVVRVAEAIRDFYFKGRTTITNDPENLESLEQMFSDFFYSWPVKISVVRNAQVGAKVYPYVFMYRGNFSFADSTTHGPKRPSHADDLQYLFQSLQVPEKNWPDLEPGSEDEKFSQKFIKLWVSFAKSSAPDGSILGANWQPIKSEEAIQENPLEWYFINNTAFAKVEDGRLRDRMKFWNEVFDESGALITSGSVIITVLSGFLIWSLLL